VLGIVHSHAEYLHNNDFVIHPKKTPILTRTFSHGS
jgi:hypothetical protein